ncbi:MAG: hypothetical protein JW755_14260 [Candidatus Aminicenantes bacterium]|nr:hypothetical protein [Candidatus Aminicenantes bacterium]
MSKLNMAVTSVFRPHDIYFSPYGYDEIREILSQRMKAGLYPGVMSNEVLDLISERTAAAEDLRAGLELLKSSARAAECAARKEILSEDVGCFSSSVCPKNFHLREAVSALSPDEKKIAKGKIRSYFFSGINCVSPVKKNPEISKNYI